MSSAPGNLVVSRGQVVGSTAKPSVSVVVPTYNERENILQLVPQLAAAFREYAYEIVVVDDDSPDRTGEAVTMLMQAYPSLRLVTKPSREGIGAALRVGYRQARGDIIVSCDADLAFDVEDLVRLVEAVTKGDDLVVGSRHMEGARYEAGTWRVRCKRSVSRLGNAIVRVVFGMPVHDVSANCRAIRQTVWRQIQTRENTNALLLEMILRCHHGGFRVRELPVTFRDRRYGTSKLRLPIEVAKFLLAMVRYRWYYLWNRPHWRRVS